MANKQIRLGLLGKYISEENRSATPLELFYDLIFVVAIANLVTIYLNIMSVTPLK